MFIFVLTCRHPGHISFSGTPQLCPSRLGANCLSIHPYYTQLLIFPVVQFTESQYLCVLYRVLFTVRTAEIDRNPPSTGKGYRELSVHSLPTVSQSCGDESMLYYVTATVVGEDKVDQ